MLPPVGVRQLVVTTGVAAAMLAGCSKEGGEICSKRAESFQVRVTQWARGPQLQVPVETDIPSLKITNPLPLLGAVVRVQGEKLFFDTEPMGLDELAPARRDRLEILKGINATDGEATLPIYIETSVATPVARLAEVRAAFPPDVEVSLLLAVEPGEAGKSPLDDAPAETRERIEAILGAADPAQRAADVARALEKAVGSCQPIRELYGRLATVEAETRWTLIRDEAPAALKKCQCKVADLDMFEYLTVGLLWGGPESQSHVPLRPSRHAIPVGPEMTVGDLVATLTDSMATAGIHLVTDP